MQNIECQVRTSQLLELKSQEKRRKIRERRIQRKRLAFASDLPDHYLLTHVKKTCCESKRTTTITPSDKWMIRLQELRNLSETYDGSLSTLCRLPEDIKTHIKDRVQDSLLLDENQHNILSKLNFGTEENSDLALYDWLLQVIGFFRLNIK